MEKPIRLIYDTDIGGDCDDAGTLGMIHRLCDLGEAKLLAVTHCYATPFVAGCIDVINRYHGRTVPIGINYKVSKPEDRGVYAAPLCEAFPNAYPPKDFGTERGPEDTVHLLRRILSREEDGAVTLVVTGALTSMAELVTSAPDDLSPLSGEELIRKKIARTVVMGGRFFESWPMAIYPDGLPYYKNTVTWEWNIKGSGLWAAQTACDRWPGDLIFASYELGSYVKTMVGYPDRAKEGDPVALAYQIHNQGKGRCSWDQTALLEAVRPGRYWNYHEMGRISVDGDFVTHWTREAGGRQTYLLPKADYEEIRQTVDGLMDQR